MVMNSKGGSGKSTVATSLASYYAGQGSKVVLVDLDPTGLQSRMAGSATQRSQHDYRYRRR